MFKILIGEENKELWRSRETLASKNRNFS